MNAIQGLPVAAARDFQPRKDVRPVVRLRNFTRSFGANTIIDGLDLDIAPGEFIALLGRSGSGKTTLLRTLAGLDDARGQEIDVPSSRAVVFQDARLLPWKPVWKNVGLGLKGGLSAGDVRARSEAALREVGLGHRLDAWPLTLSGGEAQRAALARALVREPQLLLLDEPFAAVDALTRYRMHDLVLSLWRAHRPAVLLVTHDVEGSDCACRPRAGARRRPHRRRGSHPHRARRPRGSLRHAAAQAARLSRRRSPWCGLEHRRPHASGGCG